MGGRFLKFGIRYGRKLSFGYSLNKVIEKLGVYAEIYGDVYDHVLNIQYVKQSLPTSEI